MNKMTYALSIIALLLTGSTVAQKTESSSDIKSEKTAEQISSDSLRIIIFVSFIVNKKGRVKNVGISKIEGDSCSNEIIENCKKEALRTVKTMPQWEPATPNGEPVEVGYTLPIAFTLPKSRNKKSDSPVK
jgi:hypothetical protein